MQIFRLAPAAARRLACTRYSGAAASTGRHLASSASYGRTDDPDIHARNSDMEPVVFSGEPERPIGPSEATARLLATARIHPSPQPIRAQHPAEALGRRLSLPSTLCPPPRIRQLLEIKLVDTRKPVTRVTDGTTDSSCYGGYPDVVGWRLVQLDTAEATLLKVVRICLESAVRGDPDAPQYECFEGSLR
ncbi:hypothetical protein SAY87_025208 [Trapa incisa]|uniref:Uncharacterized protein n=1 Tax=Trapa incisa TaxID=236973 RepID=A0AAN7GAK0_9MYRT|nr:hypothetical protein SAY87_025208 [Trapa incisa]